jgi:hypothetical protein
MVRMPVKLPPKERPPLEMFLSEYENGAWKNAVPDWVEERMDGAVEVIATRVKPIGRQGGSADDSSSSFASECRRKGRVGESS